MQTKHDWTATTPWIDDPSIEIAPYLSGRGFRATAVEVERLETWRRDGLVILPAAADTGDIDAYLDDIEWALENPAKMGGTVEVRGARIPTAQVNREHLRTEGTKLNSFHMYSRAALRLALSPEIQRFLQLVFLEPAAVLQTLTFWCGSEQSAHIDYPYVRTQTKLGALAASWIALEDIQADAGPLVYYPGSHRPEVSGFFDWGNGSILLEPDSNRTPNDFSRYLDERIANAGLDAKQFLPRKGDALIWHGNLIHAGSRVTRSGSTRKSFVTHYTACSAYPEAFRPQRPIEGVNQFTGRPGVAWEYPWVAGEPKLPSWSRR